jgi:CRP-like cAMP-binding protein
VPLLTTEKLRPARPLTRKLAQIITLSPAQAKLLDELQSATRAVRRHREIVTEGHTYDGVFVLVEGVAIRYRILHDGRRQILNLVLPGDFIGFPGCFFETALYSITALTDTVVVPVAFSRLIGMFDSHPRLATAIFWSFAREAAMFNEHLIDLGRRSAVERVAHFLLELLVRLQAIGMADECSYRLPLTQELIGDALGLSVPYVNRTLRQLRDDGLVMIKDQQVMILDVSGLSALADFERAYLSRFRMPAAFEQEA